MELNSLVGINNPGELDLVPISDDKSWDLGTKANVHKKYSLEMTRSYGVEEGDPGRDGSPEEA